MNGGKAAYNDFNFNFFFFVDYSERTRLLINRIIDTVLTKIKEDFVRPIPLESAAAKWKKVRAAVYYNSIKMKMN